ncbi:MAG: HU family DNA-binding protein [Deltaproteobacteria bacterium]|nr:HU family DNA-binding protein [Deltaproteobacteria bacterium]
MALTKARIVDSVQEQLGFPRNECVNLVEDLLEIIKRTLGADEDLLVSGFGKFCVKKKNKRKGRNPASGEDLMLAKRKVVSFKCSSVLRKRIGG